MALGSYIITVITGIIISLEIYKIFILATYSNYDCLKSNNYGSISHGEKKNDKRDRNKGINLSKKSKLNKNKFQKIQRNRTSNNNHINKIVPIKYKS